MVKQVKLYVEGGGDSAEQHARCRKGFRELLEKSGFSGRMPRTFAGGGRSATFDAFRTAQRSARENDYPILLVDSEDPLPNQAISAWTHLKTRDQWERPAGAEEDQAQLMVTCMETWVMADRAAIHACFGNKVNDNALLPENDLESRDRHMVQQALERATNKCKSPYCKGDRSFEVLAQLNPATLTKHLTYFRRFIDTLKRHL